MSYGVIIGYRIHHLADGWFQVVTLYRKPGWRQRTMESNEGLFATIDQAKERMQALVNSRNGADIKQTDTYSVTGVRDVASWL